MKRSNLIRLCILLTIFSIMLTGFYGCGGSAGKVTTTAVATTAAADPNSPGWKLDTSPITLDVYMNFAFYTAKWGDLDTQAITKKTGVTLNYIVPAGNENEKLTTMIASNSLPDIVSVGNSDPLIGKMEQAGMLYPINQLADKYDPYFYTVAPKSLLNWYTRTDGNVYGFISYSSALENAKPGTLYPSNQTFSVRKDIYEAIGSPDMRTPDGFLNALKMAKEKFPTVNGKPLIPFGAHEFSNSGNYTFQDYLMNYLAIPLVTNGQVADRYLDPEYIKWLKVFRKANEMGLISNDIFVDKRSQMNEKISQLQYFSIMYQHSDYSQATLYAKNPQQVYEAILGPANANLDKPVLKARASIAGFNLAMISKNCKNPERAIRFLSYLISDEGQRDLHFGPEGVTWDMVNNKITIKPEILAEYNKDSGAVSKKYGFLNTHWFFYMADYCDSKVPMQEGPYKQQEEWTYQYTAYHPELDALDPTGDTPEGTALVNINQLFGQTLPKLITAKSDAEFDTLYNQFLEKRKTLGIDSVMAAKQKLYDDHLKKLSMNK